MNAKTGQDVASMCHRCGESWHVVISMLESKIAKVECKQCHAVHRYKAPPSEAAKARGAGGKSAAAKRSKSTGKSAAKTLVEADLAKPIRAYSAKESFEAGERIQHSVFGMGIAQLSPGPGKIEVLFGSDRKLLAQAKPIARSFFG